MENKKDSDTLKNTHKNIQEYFASEIHDLALEYLDFRVQEHQRRSLSIYGKLLLEWNQRMNLTAITDPRQIIFKHFFDSAILSTKLSELFPTGFFSGSKDFVSPHIVDIGTGAGFPGMVIKIMQPHIRMTLVEAVAKKITFLEHLAGELQMDVTCLHIRAEDLGQQKDYREKADGVVSRAVADLAVLLEYAIPLIKVGGYFVAAKGRRVFEEVERAQHALKVLGACVEDIYEFGLSREAERHALVLIKKILPTPPSYPRRPGMPVKNPL